MNINNLEGELKSTLDIVMDKYNAENHGEAEQKNETMEAIPSVAEKRLEELADEVKEVIPENQQKKAAEIEARLAEIRSGKVEGVESQDQLASDYLAAYEEYKKLSEEYMQNLRQLDNMRDEIFLTGNFKAESDIANKEKEQALLSGKMNEAVRKYSKIGEKLTTETIEKYLK